MTNRITEAMNENLVARINKLAGAPEQSYTKTADGKYKCNIGNYHLSGAYGGWPVASPEEYRVKGRK